jgi:hypothetical protein
MSRLPVPVLVDGRRFPDIRQAAAFLSPRISYMRLYRALKAGRQDIEGVRISPARAETVPAPDLREERLPGTTPLLCFPHLEWGVTPRSFFS